MIGALRAHNAECAASGLLILSWRTDHITA